jgi:hypothetical protein
MKREIWLVTLFLVSSVGTLAAQEVSISVPQLDLDACLAPQTLEEWRAAGTTLGAAPLAVGESMCSVLRRRGVPAEIIIGGIEERRSEPLEMGLCFPGSGGQASLGCAILRETDGEFRVHRVESRPASGLDNR